MTAVHENLYILWFSLEAFGCPIVQSQNEASIDWIIQPDRTPSRYQHLTEPVSQKIAIS